MNGIHGRFAIANDDFLYVLSTMVFEPIRWNARFGWRPLIDTERLATFYFWREVGKLMGMSAIPADYDSFERFNVEFERNRFAYSDAGNRVGKATRDMFIGWFPGVPKSLGRPFVHALLDELLLDALGFPSPPRALRAAATASLRARSRAVRFLPEHRKPRLRTEERHRSYPERIEIERLGPPPADAVHDPALV
jgi:hypothetical protein